AEAERLFAVLRAIRDSGRSVIYVSHRLDEVMHLCDRVTVLRDGAAIATKLIAATSQNDLIRMMIGRQVDQAYPHPLAAPRQEIALGVRDLAGDTVGPLSFDLRKGEIVGIAGLAGAGQSEVLKLLMRAEKVRGGTILIDGDAELPGGLADAWRRRLAYVPRERRSEGLVLTRGITENITLAHLGRFSHGGAFLAPGREKAIAMARGEEVRLKARSLRQPCYELSGGNQQKVVFARALSVEPKVLLLDEPTRGVDVGAKFDIYSLIREWSARGMAVLIASSDFPELIGMCDRIMVMRAGRIATVLAAEGLGEEELLGQCYGHGAGAAEDVVAPSVREAAH
ncbi:MAG: sugar ABC transporter ATP-binding protein, partial [Bauldia sp.]|nr:sugar ABC transporter ATP-binding protein [Bauldia sp.]